MEQTPITERLKLVLRVRTVADVVDIFIANRQFLPKNTPPVKTEDEIYYLRNISFPKRNEKNSPSWLQGIVHRPISLVSSRKDDVRLLHRTNGYA